MIQILMNIFFYKVWARIKYLIWNIIIIIHILFFAFKVANNINSILKFS